MSRRRYIVAYDIRDPRRLRKVLLVMKGYGQHLQYSVFVCDLSRGEKAQMQVELGDVIQHRVDSVAIVDLGAIQNDTALHFEFMGARRPLPNSGPVIV